MKKNDSRYKHSEKSSGKKNGFIKVSLLLIVLLAAGIIFASCGGNENISATVSVLGNNMTDMSREQLTEAVSQIADQNPITDTVKITFLDREHVLDLKTISVRYDAEAIAEEAFSAGSQNLWNRLFGSDEVIEIPLSVTYDESRLKQAVKAACDALNKDATEFSYEITDEGVSVTKGGNEVKVDEASLLDTMKGKLDEMDYSPIALEGEITHADIDFAALKEEIDRPAKNPRLDLENDRSGKTILDGEKGIIMNIDEAKAAYEASGDSDTFSFPVEFTNPKMTRAEFSDKLFRDTLSTVTSRFNPGNRGRTTNVKLACDHCNNVILNPGDEFSYNKSVGPRTYERGFKDATVYVAGTTEEGVGGGICQVSSTIYSAALHADLKISERYNHSYMITYVPLGEDATVVYGSKDFKFVNNTDYPIKLRVTYGKSSMTVSIIGTNLTNKSVKISTKRLSSTPFEVIYKTDPNLPLDTTKVKNGGYTGYVTESYRMVYENGKLVSNTFENKSVYKKLDKLIYENPSSPDKSGNYVPPVEPVKPPEPDKPVAPEVPDVPVEPQNPVTPDTPVTPAEPAVPPEEAQKPAEPVPAP